MSYCDYCKNLPAEDNHKIYHDQHYGFPIIDDNELFGRFILEIFQAGLSWGIILKKQEGIKTAFSNNNIDAIANFSEEKIQELLQDTRIIRNRLKVHAIIHNAKEIKALQSTGTTFYDWLYTQDAKELKDWVKIFKKKFKFVGKEIVNEFLMSIGVLKGAHEETCPIFEKQISTHQKWRD